MELEQGEIVGRRMQVGTIRSGANEQGRNGLGIVLSKHLKEDLISVSKRSDIVMSIKLGVEETVVNIIILCVYVPQVGCTEE